MTLYETKDLNLSSPPIDICNSPVSTPKQENLLPVSIYSKRDYGPIIQLSSQANTLESYQTQFETG